MARVAVAERLIRLVTAAVERDRLDPAEVALAADISAAAMMSVGDGSRELFAAVMLVRGAGTPTPTS